MTRFVGVDSNSFPYSAVAYIEATFNDGTRVSGSGVLVGRNDVLTASHVLYDPIQGAAADVNVEFGRDGGALPYGAFEAAGLNYFELDTEQPGFLFQSESEYDIALVSLSDAIGDDIGWFSLGGYRSGEVYHVTGYPGVYRDTTGPRLMEDSNTAARLPGLDLIDLNNFEVNPGNSGGPVWYASSDGPVVVGTVSTDEWAADVEAHLATLDQWIKGNDDLIPPLSNKDISDGQAYLETFRTLLASAGWEMPEALDQALQSRDELLRYPSLESTIDPVLRLYTGMLAREPDKEGVEYWITQFNAGSSLRVLADSFVVSDEFTHLADQLGADAQGSIEALYRSVLGRSSDAAGQRYWLNQIESGQVELADVALAFTESPEYVTNSYSLVQGAKLLLWGSDLEAFNTEALGFENRPTAEEASEVAALVRLYTGVLGREPDEAGFDYWLEALASGKSLTSIAEDFFVSNEFLNGHVEPTQGALIDSLYQQVLMRSPDPEGVAYWQAQLQEEAFGEGNLVLAFTNSEEYVQATQPNVDSYVQQHYEQEFIGVPEDIETYLLG